VVSNLWHSQFHPHNFLSHIDIERLLKKNEAANENKVEISSANCIMCGKYGGAGLILNDKSFICRVCFTFLSTIQYPEKYENDHRDYLKNCESRRVARQSLIEKCPNLKAAKYFTVAGWVFVILLLISFNPALILGVITCFITQEVLKNKHNEKLTDWDRLYPEPKKPVLKHFHDPTAQLTNRDLIILKVFNNWPGYPPFWEYLRQVVLTKDENRCQVTGCPSRVELHIHHIKPISNGGEHVPNNLVTLCGFHHALEPDLGHERVWGEIQTKYFTVVCSHLRKNPVNPGYHEVHAHVRRLELVMGNELEELIQYYGMTCSYCGSSLLNPIVDTQSQVVEVSCLNCHKNWTGLRKLTEETGPRMAEIFNITERTGRWKPRWEMLEEREETTFKLIEKGKIIRRSETIKTTKSTKPVCPNCGSPMKLVRPRRGQQWKAFWGCSKYPLCKGSRKF